MTAEQVSEDLKGWHTIKVLSPLPLHVAGTIMQLVGAAWPQAVIAPGKEKVGGMFSRAESALTLMVPPDDPLPVADEQAQAIKGQVESEGIDAGDFLGFRIDDESKAWVSMAPPEELCRFLGSVAHQIFALTEGAVNFVEWEVHHVDGESYSLAIQKSGAKSPVTARAEVTAERDEIKAAFLELYRGIDGVADEMSDRDHGLIDRFWPLFERLTATSEEDA